MKKITRYALSRTTNKISSWGSVVSIWIDENGKETNGNSVFEGTKRDCKAIRDRRNEQLKEKVL